jgi:choloylglycine hydrolase
MKMLFLLFVTFCSLFSNACSTFLLRKDGQYVFGRNYDWITGNGAVIINSRSVKKISFAPEGGNTISWVSKWGSVSFNQFGKEFPHGGMNEKGLVVELMWLSESTYPAPDRRAALNELQWIQYQLDNSSTIEEVIASDRLVRISRQNAAPLHYLVADASGNAATIEFIHGKMVTHAGKKLAYPVLTNTVYDDALQHAKKEKITDNSVARFATACEMIQTFEQGKTKEKPVEAAFKILDKISQGNFTKWRIAYDITNRTVYFQTTDGQSRKHISFPGIDFSCKAQSSFLDINSKAKGAVTSHFSVLNFEQNKNIMEASARQSKGYIDIPAPAINAAAEYFRQVQCEP